MICCYLLSACINLAFRYPGAVASAAALACSALGRVVGISALEKIVQWPADSISGALISPLGIATVGDTAREYGIKSVTKPVVAMGIMLAVEEGAIELDQPAGPEGATRRHLLSHASGVDFDSRDAKRPVENRRIYSSAGYEGAKPLWQETNEAIWVEIQS